MVNVPNFSHVVNIKIRKAKYKMENVKIKKLKENAVIPKKAFPYDAGWDLAACLDCDSISIPVGKTIKIGTGLAIAVPNGYFGGIFARSGLSTKQGLRPANCVGVLDSSYRNEVIVPLYNDSDKVRIVKNGDRIAQLIILPVYDTNMEVVDELNETDRGLGGFGSTGIGV